jgi:hypothetical protein
MVSLLNREMEEEQEEEKELFDVRLCPATSTVTLRPKR